jgi:hypothetical protein
MRPFPDEIFGLIFRELPDNERDGVDTACRRFHAIMEPIRYRSVELQSPTKMELFLRSIVYNPRLTQHVRRMEIVWDLKDTEDRVVPEQWRNGLVLVNQYLNEKLAGSSSSAENLRTRLCREWDDYPVVSHEGISEKEEKWLMRGIEVVIVSIFFKMLTELVDLHIASSEEFFGGLDSCPGNPLVVRGVLTEGVLPNLRKVTRLEGSDCHCPTAQLVEAMIWLHHPGVQSFTFCPNRRNPYPGPPLSRSWVAKYMRTSNLTVFEHIGPMKWTLMEPMLIMPKALVEIRFFSLEPCASFAVFLSEPEGWFHRSFSRCLHQHAHSLRRLELNFVHWPEFLKDVTEFTFGTMLLDLACLEQLIAPINLFLGLDPTKRLILSDSIPSSLRVMVILPQENTNLDQQGLWDDQACIGALTIGLEKITSQCPSIFGVFLRCFTEKSSFSKFRSLIKNPKVKNILVS